MGKSVVGLDIGSSMIRGVQVTQNKNDFRLERVGEVPLPFGAVVHGSIVEEQPVIDALKTLWKNAKFTTNIVRLGLGGDPVLARAAEMDWMRDAEFSRFLPHLVADRLLIQKDEYNLDYHSLSEYPVKEQGEDEEDVRVVPKRYILVAGGKVEAVNRLISVTQAARLKPVSIDLNGLALLRIHRKEEDERTTVDVSIDIGADTLTIVLHKFGQPLYLRHVTGESGNHLTTSVQEELDVSFERAEYRKFEALYSEVPQDDSEYTTSFFDTEAAQKEAKADDEKNGDAEYQRRTRIEKVKPLLAQGASELIYVIRETLDDFFGSPMGNDLTEISGLSMSGGVSNTPGLLERIGAEFRAPVFRATPLTNLLTPKTQKSVKPETLVLENTFAVATGLAVGTGASHA